MGLPHFPPGHCPPRLETLILQLIETIVYEELSLAALINAEAEKIQAVAAAQVLGPISPEELSEINQSVGQVVEAAGRKEDRLRQKLALLLNMQFDHGDDHGRECDHDHDHH